MCGIYVYDFFFIVKCNKILGRHVIKMYFLCALIKYLKWCPGLTLAVLQYLLLFLEGMSPYVSKIDRYRCGFIRWERFILTGLRFPVLAECKIAIITSAPTPCY